MTASPIPQSLQKLSLSIPLVKLDTERRLVIGRAAVEAWDKAGEIMDYATAKPKFEQWSRECHERSGGKSLGNVRVMHNPRLAAGKLTKLAFDDDDQAIDVIAHVVDDQEWKKCLEGVYTGFSVGGGYASKWKDQRTGRTRYTPLPTEISLVDSPCMPGCTFAELVKGDGMTERLELRGVARSFGDLWAMRNPPSFADRWEARPRQAPSFAERWNQR